MGLGHESPISSSRERRTDRPRTGSGLANASFDFFDNGEWVALEPPRLLPFRGVSGAKSMMPEPWLCTEVSGECGEESLLKNPGPALENTVSVRVKSWGSS